MIAMTTATGTEGRVCKLIAQRQEMGRAKYGRTVEGNPLTQRQWLRHALEEALDLAVYLQRSIEELDKQEPPKVLPPYEPADLSALLIMGK